MLTNEIMKDTVSEKSESSKDEIVISIPEDKSDDEVRDKNYYYKKLLQAVEKDDWSTAEKIYKEDRKYIGAKLTKKRETALHIAVEAEKSSTFVLNLVGRMSTKELAIRNSAGNTAFCLVAALGKLEFAKAMLSKNSELPLIHNYRNRMYPIQMAAESGHKEMVEFIYDSTKHRDFPRHYLTSMLQSLKRVGLYDDETIKILYQAVSKGDWSTIRDIYEQHPIYITARISEKGDTTLHIAAASYSSKVALQLLKNMNQEDLAIRNADDNTAFCVVAKSGNLELAKEMLNKNSDLRLIRGENGKYPIEIAAKSGHKEIVKFLYDSTKQHHLEEDYGIPTFFTLIETAFYDVALDLLDECPDLAIHPYGYHKERALHILARAPMMSSILANQNQEGILKGSFNLFSGSNKFRHKKLHPQALELVERLWELVEDRKDGWISQVIFVAAREENIEFLTIIIHRYPELILKVNQKKQSIFHVAILNRQKDIFELIHEISPENKKTILQHKDSNDNNILHLAGMLAPSHRLNTVSGVALQLQQDLLWFEEVRKIVHPSDAEAENKKGKTPRALFTDTHAELMEKGEQWMKSSANSCMIVATLIATVVFAAAFTVPGGTKEDTGTPHFVGQVFFIIFVISDAMSLVSSTCSILIILSIDLNLQYKEEDFLWVFHRKLAFALLTLLVSIATMMVVFCATIFIVFKDGMIWVPILVSIIASFPVILFTKHQRQLLFDVARSTSTFCSVNTPFSMTKGKKQSQSRGRT